MEEKLIIEVKDVFELVHPPGLIITPMFIVPECFQELELPVRVEAPNGGTKKYECQLLKIRFRLANGTHVYRVQLNFPTATKATIPVGSKIFSSSEVLLNLQVAS